MTFHGQLEIHLGSERKIRHSLHRVRRYRQNAALKIVAYKADRVVVSDFIHRDNNIIEPGGPRVFLPEQMFNPENKGLVILVDLLQRILNRNLLQAAGQVGTISGSLSRTR